MSDDTEFDSLDELLASALRQSARIRKTSAQQAAFRDTRAVSEDYASRLAERAVFRRLLSDEALDGVRFRFLFTRYLSFPKSGHIGTFQDLDSMRKYIDQEISREESTRGPTA